MLRSTGITPRALGRIGRKMCLQPAKLIDDSIDLMWLRRCPRLAMSVVPSGLQRQNTGNSNQAATGNALKLQFFMEATTGLGDSLLILSR